MEFKLAGALNAEDEIKAADHPQIRFFTVAEHSAYRHADTIGGTWNVVSPETAAQVSAVAYYFARRIQQDIHIPIGLVVDCVGGTPAETWTSADTLRRLGGFEAQLAELQQLSTENGQEYGNYVMSWYDRYDVGLKENWADPSFDDSKWNAVNIMNGWGALGVPDTPSVVWFRKEVTLPDPLPAGRSALFLGVVDRMDSVWVNGKYVGGSAWVENPRRYFLHEGALKPGKNLLAIRILRTGASGGFLGKPADLHLVLGDQSSIALEGDWETKVSVDARPPHSLPLSDENWPVVPSVLYRGMLEPIGSLSITGAIWYQGEANAKPQRDFDYRKVLPAMITDWRKLFDQGDFPFYIVSLPAFQLRSPTPVDDDLRAVTRESQAVAAATVPNSCLAVTVDTGDPDTVHPKDKVPVGERLANCALANYYRENIPYQGPTLASAELFAGGAGAVRLHFAHAEGGLVVKGDKAAEFSVAGDDHKWYWADGEVFGDTVIVSSAAVQNPKEIRYAWQSNPAATLYNKAGLPAVPFRTLSADWTQIREGDALEPLDASSNTYEIPARDASLLNKMLPLPKAPVVETPAFCAPAGSVESVSSSRPTLTTAELLPGAAGAIHLRFAHAEDGLILKDGKSPAFFVAGDDHQWLPADPHLFGDIVTVSNSAVQTPKAVRYTWPADSTGVLFDKAGESVAPFCKDTSSGLTEERRPNT
jgi:sialate O-acetylesterase